MKLDHLVSIIIPTYNRADLIGETLNSVLFQTYNSWECIIVDDRSSDNTKEIAEGYVKKDPRFKFYVRPSEMEKGASICRNYGLRQAKGQYIQFLDSDDLLNETKLQIQIEALMDAPPFSLATSKFGSFSNSSNLRVKIKYRSYRNFKNSIDLLYTFGKYNEYFPPHVYLVPIEVIKKAGYWDETIKNNPNDDGEYFTRVIINSSKVIFCEAAEVYYRAGDNERLSLLNNEEKVKGAIESWKMIKSNLEKKSRKVSLIYVENGKKNIYDQITNSHPEILIEYQDFFKFRKKFKWFG